MWAKIKRHRCRETGEDLTEPPEQADPVPRGDPAERRARLEEQRKRDDQRRNPPPPEPDDGTPF